MKESDENLRDLVRRAIGPADPELKRDLWPRMRARIEETPPARVPWWDWALAAAVAGCLVAFPAAIPALLYQL
jgi:hypothetical protein